MMNAGINILVQGRAMQQRTTDEQLRARSRFSDIPGKLQSHLLPRSLPFFHCLPSSSKEICKHPFI
jgi:hypothetical protein